MLLHSPYPLSPWPPWHHVESSSGVCQPQPQPRPVSSAASTASCRKAQLQLPSFTFYDVHGVSEWQTTPGRWPWQTAAAALVPAGHTKVCSSQLVSLSLWLNAWWREIRLPWGAHKSLGTKTKLIVPRPNFRHVSCTFTLLIWRILKQKVCVIKMGHLIWGQFRTNNAQD